MKEFRAQLPSEQVGWEFAQKRFEQTGDGVRIVVFVASQQIEIAIYRSSMGSDELKTHRPLLTPHQPGLTGIEAVLEHTNDIGAATETEYSLFTFGIL